MKFQTVTIILKDGSRHSFTGPAGVKEGEIAVAIEFSEPQEMPPGYSFENIPRPK